MHDTVCSEIYGTTYTQVQYKLININARPAAPLPAINVRISLKSKSHKMQIPNEWCVTEKESVNDRDKIKTVKLNLYH